MNPSGTQQVGRLSAASLMLCGVLALAFGGCSTFKRWDKAPAQTQALELNKMYQISPTGAYWFDRPIRSVFEKPTGILPPGMRVTLLHFERYQALVRVPNGTQVYMHPSLLEPPRESQTVSLAAAPQPSPSPATPPPQTEPQPTPEVETGAAAGTTAEPAAAATLPEMRVNDEFELN